MVIICKYIGAWQLQISAFLPTGVVFWNLISNVYWNANYKHKCYCYHPVCWCCLSQYYPEDFLCYCLQTICVYFTVNKIQTSTLHVHKIYIHACFFFLFFHISRKLSLTSKVSILITIYFTSVMIKYNKLMIWCRKKYSIFSSFVTFVYLLLHFSSHFEGGKNRHN